MSCATPTTCRHGTDGPGVGGGRRGVRREEADDLGRRHRGREAPDPARERPAQREVRAGRGRRRRPAPEALQGDQAEDRQSEKDDDDLRATREDSSAPSLPELHRPARAPERVAEDLGQLDLVTGIEAEDPSVVEDLDLPTDRDEPSPPRHV